MSPRRFAVSHQKRQGHAAGRLASSSWSRLNRAAKVRLIVQRKQAATRWVTVGTLTRSVKAGTGEVRFTGRFGKRLLQARAPTGSWSRA